LGEVALEWRGHDLLERQPGEHRPVAADRLAVSAQHRSPVGLDLPAELVHLGRRLAGPERACVEPARPGPGRRLLALRASRRGLRRLLRGGSLAGSGLPGLGGRGHARSLMRPRRPGDWAFRTCYVEPRSTPLAGKLRTDRSAYPRRPVFEERLT